MIKLNISPEAQKDLFDLKKYITEDLENSVAANNVITRITKRIRELSKFPSLGTPLESVISIQTDYRFLVSGHYTVFYRSNETDVYIDRVLYGRRDIVKILFGEPIEDAYD